AYVLTRPQQPGRAQQGAEVQGVLGDVVGGWKAARNTGNLHIPQQNVESDRAHHDEQQHACHHHHEVVEAPESRLRRVHRAAFSRSDEGVLVCHAAHDFLDSKARSFGPWTGLVLMRSAQPASYTASRYFAVSVALKVSGWMPDAFCFFFSSSPSLRQYAELASTSMAIFCMKSRCCGVMAFHLSRFMINET